MILVCGGLADTVTELVCARLMDCGYHYRLLDLGHYPAGFQVKWQWEQSGPAGYIEGPDWKVDLDDLTGVFVRFLGPEGREPLLDIPSTDVPSMYAEYDTGLMILLEDLQCAVVNRVGGGISNNSKPYQAMIVRRCGLLTPPTLITTDPETAHRFFEEFQGQVIYKSLSGIRSIVRRLQPDQLDRLSLLRNGPVQFQQFIPGINVRVHTVGEQLFATRVYSDVVDYRYAGSEGGSIDMEAATLPPEIEASCLRLAREMDLSMTGIDLKETPDGDFYCFEVNPCPGFLYYEKGTGQPISLALAELLCTGSRSEPRDEPEARLLAASTMPVTPLNVQ